MKSLAVVKFKFFHWFYYQWKKHYYFNFSIGILTWLYQGLNLPFSAQIDNTSNFFILIFILIPFGLAWPLLSYIIDFFTGKILKLKVSENEKVAFIVLLCKILIFIHTALILQGYFCYWECVNIIEYLELWIKTLILFIPVYFIFTIYAKNRFFYFSKKEDGRKGKFEFKGSGKNSLWLNLKDVIYIKSDDNYVDIVSLNDSRELNTEILRTTLESIVKQLEKNTEFVRVHRSSIVNLRYVKDLVENKSLKLGYEDLELKISVSKTYLDELKTILSS